MHKIKFIIWREYTTRVRKRAFIIMTIIGPILFASIMILPLWLAQLEDKEIKNIAVVEFDSENNPVPDSKMIFKDVLEDKDKLHFLYIGNLTMKDIENLVALDTYFGFLVLNHDLLNSGKNVEVDFFCSKQPSLGIEVYISQKLGKFIHDQKLVKRRISPKIIESVDTEVTLLTQKLQKGGFKEQQRIDLKRGLGYASSFLIYIFIFFFGSQVMRGVIEEKTNRIVEVVITSVKPFQLMMGKIVGIGMVGLTQFMAWVILTSTLYIGASNLILNDIIGKKDDMTANQTELFDSLSQSNETYEPSIGNIQMSTINDAIEELNLSNVILGFIFYFLAGYLLYGAMFAAVGSAVDSDTDTQQFMLPITVPLVIAIVVMVNAITNPEGQLAYWFSMIPFTSPIVMMARIPFDPPNSEIALSMIILAVSFILFTWLSSRIYRTGILMYGKKVRYRELFKWLFYKM